MINGIRRVGYCFTGSHCTLSRSLTQLRRLAEEGYELVPIMSENVYYTDTRFYRAEDFSREVEQICGRTVIHTVSDAEPLGPKTPLDLLIIAPCTGNTLAKLAHGITDTAATMAAKAHLRSDRPTLLAVASNDALSMNLSNIATMMRRRSVYLVPMRQDDPIGKPHSLVAELERIPECIEALSLGVQLRPIFI